MPDPLHPAAPVVPAAPAEPVRNPSPSFGELLALLDGPSPPILKAPLSPDFYAGQLGMPVRSARLVDDGAKLEFNPFEPLSLIQMVGANGARASFPLLADPSEPAPEPSRLPRAQGLDRFFLGGRSHPSAAEPLPIDLAEPDAPAPVGDRVPCHLFWAPPADPLPPVLRRDRAPAGSLLDALGPWLEADLDAAPPAAVGVTDPARVLLEVPDGRGLLPFDPARLSAWLTDAPPPPRRSWLRQVWDDHHEWITVGLILALAAAALLHAHAAKAAVVVVPRVVIVPRVVVPPRPAPARPAPAPARQPEAAPRAPVIVPVIPAAPACSKERRDRREC